MLYHLSHLGSPIGAQILLNWFSASLPCPGLLSLSQRSIFQRPKWAPKHADLQLCPRFEDRNDLKPRSTGTCAAYSFRVWWEGRMPSGLLSPHQGALQGSNLNSQQGLCNVTYHSHSTEAGWLPVAKRCCFLAKTASHSLEQHWPGGLEVLMELLMGLAVLLWQDRSLCLWGLSFLCL